MQKITKDEVLLEDDLMYYLLLQYQSNGLTVNEAKSIILQIKALPDSDLYEITKTIMKWLADGFILKTGRQKSKRLSSISYRLQ